MIYALDIETSCGVTNCPGKCEHSVHPYQNKIDIIGVHDGETYTVFRTVGEFDQFLVDTGASFVGHRVVFDYKTLRAHGSKLSPRHIVGDTQLLASIIGDKISEEWLESYNEERRARVKDGESHRAGTPLSLKTLAPYFLGVDPFWEVADHNDTEYNRKDCEYTLRLHSRLLKEAESDGVLDFYKEYLLPWSKLLAEAELEGVLIDEKEMQKEYVQALQVLQGRKEMVERDSAVAFSEYRARELAKFRKEINDKCDDYISRRVRDPRKIDGVRERYNGSYNRRVEGFQSNINFASPKQVKEVLSFFKIDMHIEKRNEEGEFEDAEETNKFVLKRAKVGGKEFAGVLLNYRQAETETRYLKQYLESTVNGRIYTNFNVTGTRTGRLSSSGPNLQNVKGALRGPFVVADSSRYSIYTVDSSQIEPRLVAYYTGDAELVELFRSGGDFHSFAAKRFFPEQLRGVAEGRVKKEFPDLRKTAKIGGLSILYGTGANTFRNMALLREEMLISEEEARKMIKDFRAGMASVFSWKRGLEQAFMNGQPIHSMHGRLVQAPKDRLHMTLFNSLIQGSASDLILHSSLLAFREFCRRKIDAKPLMWVHDEVIYRFPKGAEEECKSIVDFYMTKHWELDTPNGRVPLDVEGHIGDRWQK